MLLRPTPESIIDHAWKGFDHHFTGLTVSQARARNASLLDGDFLMPVAVLKRSAIDQNIRSMSAFVATAGVELCPHGKTTMSPEIFDAQLNAGAWGITAATAHHVRLYRRWGVDRILLANQLIAPRDIALVLDLLEKEEFEFFCLVDSHAGIRILADAVEERNLGRPLNVLLEVGAAHGRTGVRSLAAGMALAEDIYSRRQNLALRGIEIFEGIHPFTGEGPAAAIAMLEDMTMLARRILDSGLFAQGEIIMTGGGSALFDLCARKLMDIDLDARARIVLRSGCYVTHDHGTYASALTEIHKRQPKALVGCLNLEPALEVWGVVQSLPEPNFAVLNLGKRDVGFDVDLPVPVWRYRAGDKRPVPAPTRLRIAKLYDQHACLEGADGLAIGDLIGLGISHPCSTFDRWRAIPVVDDSYRMISLVTTAF